MQKLVIYLLKTPKIIKSPIFRAYSLFKKTKNILTLPKLGRFGTATNDKLPLNCIKGAKMAITTTGFQAPATKREGLKPSVYDKIILIGADEAPMLSLIGTSSVKGIEHSSLTDSLAAPKKNAQLEISDFDDQIKSSAQKTSNVVQIFTSNVSVSKSMQAVATYGGKELERETAKRAKEQKSISWIWSMLSLV